MAIRQCVWEGVGGLKNYSKRTIGQPKLDGSQCHLHIKNHKAYALTSRRISKRTGKLSEKIYHFPKTKQTYFPFKKETIIVCEVSADHLYDDFKAEKIINKKGVAFNWSKRSNYVASVMNSNESENHGLILVAFDVMYWEGKNVEEMHYEHKLDLLELHFDTKEFNGKNKFGEQRVYSIPCYEVQNKNEVDILFKETTVDFKLEGIVVKDLDSNKSQKIKIEHDADCIIIGYVPGTGKYAENDWIGSIIVGVFDKVPKGMGGNSMSANDMKNQLRHARIIEVGKISGFNEEFRAKISKSKGHYLGLILHCKYMQWTGKKMRHPRVGEKLIREDKLLKRCTLNQFED